MKGAVIVLIIVSLGLAVGWISRHNKANAAAEAALKSWETSSNELVKLKTEVMLEQVKAGQMRTNLQAQLDKRTADLNVYSNRLFQVNLVLTGAENDKHSAHADAAAKASRISDLETMHADTTRRMNELVGSVTALQAKLSETEKLATLCESERTVLVSELGVRRAVVEDLLAKFNDEDVLRAQLDRVKDRPRPGSAKAGRAKQLELQPDGSVRVVAAGDNAPVK